MEGTQNALRFVYFIITVVMVFIIVMYLLYKGTYMFSLLLFTIGLSVYIVLR